MVRDVMMRAIALLLVSVGLITHQTAIADDITDSINNNITDQRITELTHMVLQDCGSCHGMRLTGGLGPSLIPNDLKNNHPKALASIISHGIPGTAMPPWNLILPDHEIQWIANQLVSGGFVDNALAEKTVEKGITR